ncbi:MAG: hypothetical protein U0271_37610 [Polyangiaceae bacterium]
MMLALTSCADDSSTQPTPDGPVAVDLADFVDEDKEGTLLLDDLGETREVDINVGDAPVVLEIDVRGPASVAPTLKDSSGADAGPLAEGWDGGAWFRPRVIDGGTLTLTLGAGVTSVTISARGTPPPAVRRERSLAWTDAALLDDESAVGLGRVLSAASDDGQGGVLLDRWLRRFATTSHSERAGPAQLMDELATTYGVDPSSWPLDDLPFKVTGVHNRLDLGPRGGGCGELRVSLASTHPIYSPLHVLFLFRQPPREDDVAPDGSVHCMGAARRWARLSALDGDAFLDAARAVLDEGLVHERFLLAESVELTVSPWEWRQWKPTGNADELDNPALFQTVAIPILNTPGALRDDFLGFVDENAEALASRTLEIPERFRGASARVPPSAPAEELSLDGIDANILATYPDLARSIERVGCPKCHTENANFVQTTVDRTFSPFYDLELDARKTRLDAQAAGDAVPTPPFGSLQGDP